MKLKKLVIILTMPFVPFILSAGTLLNEGFESSVPPTGWIILNLGDDISGETWMQSSSHHHSGDYSAFSQDGASNEGMEEWLITPAIEVPSNNYIELNFWHKFQWASDGSSPDYVMISTTTPTADAFTDTVFKVSKPGPAGWAEVLLNNLPDYAGQTIYITFVHTSASGSGYGDAWALDDILLESYEKGETDIGMLSILSPTEYSYINTDILPSGVIKNYGNTEISDTFKVCCQIIDKSIVTVYCDTLVYTKGLIIEEVDTVIFTNAWVPADTGDYFVTITTILNGDENHVNDTVNTVTKVARHYGTGGPDAFGYQWIDSEVEGGPVFNWIEISATGTSAVTYKVPEFYGDDNFSAPIGFGFDFPFYGIKRDSFYVDINGEILLTDNTWYNSYPNTGWGTDGNMFNYIYPVPGNSTMPALIAAYWDDLKADEGVGDVYFQTFGEAPDCYCVVEWHNLRFRYGTVEDTTLCFEVIFHENGEIIFQYKNTAIGQTGSVCPHDNGQSATVAIQNDACDIGLCYLMEIVDGSEYVGVEPIGNLLQNELAIRFYTGIDEQPPTFVYDGRGNTFNNTPEFKIKISDMSGLVSDSLYYNIGQGWQSVTHSYFEEPNVYYYELPEIPNNTTVYYYFAATDSSDAYNRGTLPANAPDSSLSFKILPTDDLVILLVYSGNQDYNRKEFQKFTSALNAASVSYDVYNCEEYEDYYFPDNYKAIFVYANSAGGSSKHDTLSNKLMNFLDRGTNENPKNIFFASDDFAYSQHGYPNSKPMTKFYTAYLRGGYIPIANPEQPPFGGTDGIGGPDIYDYSSGSVLGVSGSPIGQAGVELPIYSNSPDVIHGQDCPDWYESEVVNPSISSYSSFLFEDGPISGKAYANGNSCAIWLDNIIYKSFFISFDISQFTNDNDINMIIDDAIVWFEVDSSVVIGGPDIKIPGKLELSQNYPNPFNPVTSISFNLPKQTKVSLKVCDINGRLIKILIDKNIENGRHTITWNGVNDMGISVSSGVYFYLLETEGKTITKKMILLK